MNEEVMGLAGQGMAQEAAPMQGGQGEMEQMVVQVAQLIMQGATVEELLARGVPQEVIDMAMQLVNAQSVGQAPQAMGRDNSGLAGSSL